jgi:hypothetical protein
VSERSGETGEKQKAVVFSTLLKQVQEEDSIISKYIPLLTLFRQVQHSEFKTDGDAQIEEDHPNRPNRRLHPLQKEQKPEQHEAI